MRCGRTPRGQADGRSVWTRLCGTTAALRADCLLERSTQSASTRLATLGAFTPEYPDAEAVVGPHANTGADLCVFTPSNRHNQIMDFEPG